jgi:tetratricopeptide (TPR) repeat protein
MESSEGRERGEATEALEKLARQAKNKIGLHALGVAHFVNGNLKEAQARLEQAVNDLSDEAPNPLAYRSYATLAEILLAAGDLPGARKQAEAGNKLNPGYFPGNGVLARIAVRQGEPEHALEVLQPMFTELKDAVPPAMQLVYAEAIATRKGATASDKTNATEILRKIKDQVPQPELSRVAAGIDPKLPKELGIPEPISPDAAKPPEPKGRPRHR